MYDIAIIGAGLAGSSMANVLGASGWKTIIIDQHKFPRHKACGEFLSPESQGIFARMELDGLVQSLQPRSVEHVHLYAKDGSKLSIPLPGTALGVSRYKLDHALLNAAREKGVETKCGSKVVQVTPQTNGYQLVLKQKKQLYYIEARAVVAAWGRNGQSSMTQHVKPSHQQLFLRTRFGKFQRHHALIGLKTHIEGWRQASAVELYFFPGGYIGISPIEGHRHNAAAILTQEAFTAAGKSIEGVIAYAAKHNAQLSRRMMNVSLIPGTHAAVSPVVITPKPHAWGDFPYIGDAAMVIPPMCGDGMAMALRSAELCASHADRYLCGDISINEWHSNYTRVLHREFMGPARWGSMLHVALNHTTLSPILFLIGRYAPALAYRFVQLTRLNI